MPAAGVGRRGRAMLLLPVEPVGGLLPLRDLSPTVVVVALAAAAHVLAPVADSAATLLLLRLIQNYEVIKMVNR